MHLLQDLPCSTLCKAARGFVLLRRVFRISIAADKDAPGFRFEFFHSLTPKQSMRPVSIIR